MKRIGAFISIPKNASKTVLHVLRLGENRDVDDTDSAVVYENHQRGQILAERYNLDDLFVFCFVRNPYQRCASWYRFHAQRGIQPYARMDFNTWIGCGMPHHFTIQNLTNYPALGLSPLLQSVYVRQCKVDFVGRLETFDADLASVVVRLNAILESRGESPQFRYEPARCNTSGPPDDYLSYYTDESRKRVYTDLREDFERLGYSR